MQQIKRDLTKAGFEVLVDQDRFSLSYSTTPEMNRLVDAANLVLVLLSAESVRSKPVQHKLTRALKREQVEHRKLVFAAKVSPCSRVIPGWPKDRLWASLYSDYSSSFQRLVNNLRKAAKSVVPLAQHSATAEELANTAEALLSKSGMRIYGQIVFFSRFGKRLDDDPTRRIFALPTTYEKVVGPTFLVTYRDWMLFWHFPVPALTLQALHYLSEPMLLARELLDARIEGYLSRPDRKHCDPWMDEAAKVAKRHRHLLDVVVSPHTIARSHYVRQNLSFLTWGREKPFLLYHQRHTYSPWHGLPSFFGPKTQTTEDLHSVIRLLKASIRVEIPRLRIPAAQWHFLDRSA